MLISVPGQKARIGVEFSGLDRDGDPVVLLHGIGGSSRRDFSSLRPMLARRRPVIAVDFADPMRDGAPPLRLEHLVEQTCTVLDAVLPGRRPAVIGQSIGAAVALALAADGRPVSALVLAAGWLTSTRTIRMYSDIWQRCASSTPEVLAQLAGLATVSPEFPYDAERQVVEMSRNPADVAFTAAQIRVAADLDLRAAAGDVDVPTLVIAGTADLLAGRHQSELLAGAIARARYTEIHSGHLISLEKPAEMLMVIERFLAASRSPMLPAPALGSMGSPSHGVGGRALGGH